MNAQLIQPAVQTSHPGSLQSCWQRASDSLLASGEPAVAQLADRVQREPLLQGWLLTAAGQPAEARHHLLALIADDLAAARPDADLHWVFDLMEDEAVHEAVVEEVFRRGGFDPDGEGAWRGQAARCQLAEVDERLASLSNTLLAESVQ